MPDALTADAILAMPAGDELDELVATRVLGWTKDDGCLWQHNDESRNWNMNVPGFSTHLSNVERVLNWLRERWGGYVEISITPSLVHVIRTRYDFKTIFSADTLPLALCRAALLETLPEAPP